MTAPVNDGEIKPWPLGGYAPGNYSGRCKSCGKDIVAAKHSTSCLECAVVSAKRAILPTAPVNDGEWRPTHRHNKRGSTYRVVGTASLQAGAPVEEPTELVIYQGEDGRLWARPEDEFNDGRFTALSAAPPRHEQDVREAVARALHREAELRRQRRTAMTPFVPEPWENLSPGRRRTFFDDADAALSAMPAPAAPDLLEALRSCQSALASMIDPDAIKSSTVLNAFTQATEAEAKARRAIAKAEGADPCQ